MTKLSDKRLKQIRAARARWYERHGAEYLARQKRRRKYDKDFATSVRDSALKYRDENKYEINEQRRERIESDPQYAEQLRQQHANWRERVKAGHVPQWPSLYITIKGKETRVYRQSEVARLLGCSPAVLIRWRKGGWIPEATHWHRNRRVYTADQVALIGWFSEQAAHDFDARSNASKEIFAKW